MSDQQVTERKYPIPGRRHIDSFAHVQTSFHLREIVHCAEVTVSDDLGIRLSLGDLDISLQPDVWRPIIAALNAALGDIDGTPQVDIPDNLDALITAIEDAEALDAGGA